MICLACLSGDALTGFVACAVCRNLGRVKMANVHRAPPAVRIYGRLRIEGECWIYEGSVTPQGYPAHVMVHGKQIRPYRWVLLQTTVWPGAGYEADHRCFNRACCRPDHLQWLTRADNVRQRQRPLLTEAEKRERWNRYMTGYRQRNKAKIRAIRRKSDRKRHSLRRTHN
jgi:hypothetical protein